jgi:hypothetical protein
MTRTWTRVVGRDGLGYDQTIECGYAILLCPRLGLLWILPQGWEDDPTSCATACVATVADALALARRGIQTEGGSV